MVSHSSMCASPGARGLSACEGGPGSPAVSAACCCPPAAAASAATSSTAASSAAASAAVSASAASSPAAPTSAAASLDGGTSYWATSGSGGSGGRLAYASRSSCPIASACARGVAIIEAVQVSTHCRMSSKHTCSALRFPFPPNTWRSPSLNPHSPHRAKCRARPLSAPPCRTPAPALHLQQLLAICTPPHYPLCNPHI